jgi:hypothetical protein
MGVSPGATETAFSSDGGDSGPAREVDGDSDDCVYPEVGSDQIALAGPVQARHSAVRTTRPVRR